MVKLLKSRITVIKDKSVKLIAFTLAEVLITLGIIGVVAALTIPILINNYQQQQKLGLLKKDYATFAQAVRLSENDNGSNETWDWGDGTGTLATPRASFDKYWAPYLKIMKYCTSYTDCGYQDNNFYEESGSVALSVVNSTKSTTVYLVDGTAFGVWASSGTHLIYFDLNAGQGPNKYGIDVFLFELLPGKGFWPLGIQYSHVCETGYGFYNCAAKIMRDGWQIKSDYPAPF